MSLSWVCCRSAATAICQLTRCHTARLAAPQEGLDTLLLHGHVERPLHPGIVRGHFTLCGPTAGHHVQPYLGLTKCRAAGRNDDVGMQGQFASIPNADPLKAAITGLEQSAIAFQ